MGGERILEGNNWLRQCNRVQVGGERTLGRELAQVGEAIRGGTIDHC